MTILQKDFNYEVVLGEVYTTSTPGTPATDAYWTSTPPVAPSPVTMPVSDAVVTTSAINETQGSVRVATWGEVRSLWPWVRYEPWIQQKIIDIVFSTQTLGATIYSKFNYRKLDQPLDGGRLQVYVGYLIVYKVWYNGKMGIGFCIHTGLPIIQIPNPVYAYSTDYDPYA